MSAFLLYHRKTRPTGRKLAEVLGIPGGVEVRGNPSLVIRWGNQRGYYRSINPSAAMALASDKLAAFRAWEGVVNIPEFRTEGGECEGVWLGRKRHGFGGRDIQVFAQYTNLPRCGHPGDANEFYTKVIPNEREYRIHVFNGEVIRVQRKYLDHPEQQRNEYVKNYANGYRFRTPRLQLRPERLDAAKLAVETLGLTWGAVDAVVGLDDRTYILEVNTAPKLAPLTMRQYAEAFKTLLADDHNIELNLNFNCLEGLNDDE